MALEASMTKRASLFLVVALILPGMAQTPYEPGDLSAKKKVVKKQIMLNPGHPRLSAQL
jgi:hypothetical protein